MGRRGRGHDGAGVDGACRVRQLGNGQSGNRSNYGCVCIGGRRQLQCLIPARARAIARQVPCCTSLFCILRWPGEKCMNHVRWQTTAFSHGSGLRLPLRGVSAGTESCRSSSPPGGPQPRTSIAALEPTFITLVPAYRLKLGMSLACSLTHPGASGFCANDTPNNRTKHSLLGRHPTFCCVAIYMTAVLSFSQQQRG